MMNRRLQIHPATCYFLLMVVVTLLSWIGNIYGWSALDPSTGEMVQVKSLISANYIRQFLLNVYSDFANYSSIGMVVICVFAIGVVEHSGLIRAIMQQLFKGNPSQNFCITTVVLMGIMSNVMSDMGYILLMPIAVVLFESARMHPIAGIITAYLSVACGFSANLFLSTLDPLLAGTTQEALTMNASVVGHIGPLSNFFFMFVSTFLIAAILYVVVRREIIPKINKKYGVTSSFATKMLSRKERIALYIAYGVGAIYLLLILVITFSPWAIVDGAAGWLSHSPIVTGAVFVISMGLILMGVVYGVVMGRYRSDAEVVDGLSHLTRFLAVYLIIAFFAAWMYMGYKYSQLDQFTVLTLADNFHFLPDSGWASLLLFILLTAVANIFMVSATLKWHYYSFVFVPLFIHLGVSPDWTQCAYRIGDSLTNAYSPFMIYMPLLFAYMQQYDNKAGFGVFFKLTWRFSLYLLLAWGLLFSVWYIGNIPLGF